jgi:hypothetical protein
VCAAGLSAFQRETSRLPAPDSAEDCKRVAQLAQEFANTLDNKVRRCTPHTNTLTCTHIYTRTPTFTCSSHLYTHTYTHSHPNIHTHTHTHTHTDTHNATCPHLWTTYDVARVGGGGPGLGCEGGPLFLRVHQPDGGRGGRDRRAGGANLTRSRQKNIIASQA